MTFKNDCYTYYTICTLILKSETKTPPNHWDNNLSTRENITVDVKKQTFLLTA